MDSRCFAFPLTIHSMDKVITEDDRHTHVTLKELF